ncbi:hypothetical protein BDV24DRAFT_162456 [Aspergillus arachidicola]|uniref:Uncharacterized protein n=1 Tax=Aspergillus arachidicola TaxID=656916 RepID=A0A5N6YAQ6_9EURO|nr:hypothetical protein BDV24DRAFT_162456 [Aspergillus arachidicola]
MSDESEKSEVYNVKEINIASPPKYCKSFEKNWAGVSFKGYIDTASLDIVVDSTLGGARTGLVSGSIKDDVVQDVRLESVNGQVVFYLKNGGEIWVRGGLRFTNGNIFNTEDRITDIF